MNGASVAFSSAFAVSMSACATAMAGLLRSAIATAPSRVIGKTESEKTGRTRPDGGDPMTRM